VEEEEAQALATLTALPGDVTTASGSLASSRSSTPCAVRPDQIPGAVRVLPYGPRRSASFVLTRPHQRNQHHQPLWRTNHAETRRESAPAPSLKTPSSPSWRQPQLDAAGSAQSMSTSLCSGTVSLSANIWVRVMQSFFQHDYDSLPIFFTGRE